MALVTSTEMFKKAYDGGYAIGAFNVNNMEIIQGITEAAIEEQRSADPAGFHRRARVCQARLPDEADRGRHVDAEQTAALICPSACTSTTAIRFELCKSCIDGGFTSVMIDGIHQVLRGQHRADQAGRRVRARPRRGGRRRAGHAWPASRTRSTFPPRTPPTPVPRRSRSSSPRPACDSLAIAIGTSHGAYKFKPQCTARRASGHRCASTSWRRSPSRLPGFPIVLHGASSVSAGVREDDQRQRRQDARRHRHPRGACSARRLACAVCKINIDSDLRLAMTGSIRQYFNEHPDHFDPRQYLKPARANIKRLVQHKLVNVLGCNGKA